jgi:hypothetical protein
MGLKYLEVYRCIYFYFKYRRKFNNGFSVFAHHTITKLITYTKSIVLQISVRNVPFSFNNPKAIILIQLSKNIKTTITLSIYSIILKFQEVKYNTYLFLFEHLYDLDMFPFPLAID